MATLPRSTDPRDRLAELRRILAPSTSRAFGMIVLAIAIAALLLLAHGPR